MGDARFDSPNATACALWNLVVTVAEDSTFNYRLAGHVETGKDSFSDPALGGLVNPKG
jgi:phospholipase C